MYKSILGLLVLVLLSTTMLIAPSVTYACSCAPPPPVAEELQRKTAIFAGKVVDINTPVLSGIIRSSADPVKVKFDVHTSWKGVDSSSVTITTARDSASCGFHFEIGREYLVYAYGDENDLRTGLCERTAPLANAAADLDELGEGKTLQEQQEGHSPERSPEQSTQNESSKHSQQEVVSEPLGNNPFYVWLYMGIGAVLIIVPVTLLLLRIRKKS